MVKRKLIVLMLLIMFVLTISIPIFAFPPSDEIVYKGIDVSEWQGNINFKEVAEEGIEVVYIRVSEGTNYKDPYFKENYDKEQLKLVADIKNDAYYVEMMNAWYYATALIDHYDDVIIYLKNSLLSIDVHNKTIQKAIDSYRISPEKKEYLRSLRRKKGSPKGKPPTVSL